MHQFLASEHGQASIEVTFANGGARTLSLRDPASQTELASLAVSVVGPGSGIPPLPSPATPAPAVPQHTAPSPISASPTVIVPPSAPAGAAPNHAPAPTVVVPPAQPTSTRQTAAEQDSGRPATANLPPSALDRTLAHVASGRQEQTGPMALSGGTSDFTYTARTLAASVAGVACASTTQTYTSLYSLSLPASCGSAAQAVTVTVAGAAAGLKTSGGAA